MVHRTPNANRMKIYCIVPFLLVFTMMNSCGAESDGNKFRPCDHLTETFSFSTEGFDGDELKMIQVIVFERRDSKKATDTIYFHDRLPRNEPGKEAGTTVSYFATDTLISEKYDFEISIGSHYSYYVSDIKLGRVHHEHGHDICGISSIKVNGNEWHGPLYFKKSEYTPQP